MGAPAAGKRRGASAGPGVGAGAPTPWHAAQGPPGCSKEATRAARGPGPSRRPRAGPARRGAGRGGAPRPAGGGQGGGTLGGRQEHLAGAQRGRGFLPRGRGRNGRGDRGCRGRASPTRPHAPEALGGPGIRGPRRGGGQGTGCDRAPKSGRRRQGACGPRCTRCARTAWRAETGARRSAAGRPLRGASRGGRRCHHAHRYGTSALPLLGQGAPPPQR